MLADSWDQQLFFSTCAEGDSTLAATSGEIEGDPLCGGRMAPFFEPLPASNGAGTDLPYWVAFTRVRGIGPARFRRLIEAFGNAATAWRAPLSALAATGIDRRTVEAFMAQRQHIDPENELAKLERLGISTITWCDEAYPRLLRYTDSPPPVLYVRGTLLPADEWAIAVVGTRKATAYGGQVTERLVTELARQQITVVSGLARGIDTIAHLAALKADGRTFAVLGCGLDIVYPPENRKLAERIAVHGALITEFPLGTQPEAGNFPARNRLISGLSLGVLVTEAPERSGALITARFAGEQGREVFGVPGSILSSSSIGVHNLLRDGAKLVQRVEDILEEINLSFVPQRLEMRELLPENDAEAAVLGVLGTTPLHIDEICRACNRPIADVSSTLTMLELKGLVRQTGAMCYVVGP
jgi:DNA processing protein